MRFGLLLTGVLALAVTLPGIGAAAEPIVNEHSIIKETFPDEFCGVAGTTNITVVDNFKLYGDGTFLDNGRFENVFTADGSGKQVRISGAGGTSGLDEPIDNGDGTVTFVSTFRGLPERLSIVHGPTLLRDAGNVTIETTFFVEPDGELTFVSRSVSSEKGPHPDLDSGFEAFCDVIGPALA